MSSSDSESVCSDDGPVPFEEWKHFMDDIVLFEGYDIRDLYSIDSCRVEFAGQSSKQTACRSLEDFAHRVVIYKSDIKYHTAEYLSKLGKVTLKKDTDFRHGTGMVDRRIENDGCTCVII